MFTVMDTKTHQSDFVRTLLKGFHPKSTFYILMGVLPPYNFQAGHPIKSKYFKIKVFFLVLSCSVFNYATIYERYVIGRKYQLALMANILSYILNWLASMTFVAFTVIKEKTFYNVFGELGTIERHSNSPDSTLREKALARKINCQLGVFHIMFLQHMIVYHAWYFRWIHRSVTVSFNFFRMDLLYTYYTNIILCATELLLESCKYKYQELNHMIFTVKHTKIYDEAILSKQISEIRFVFKKLSKIVVMLNDILGSLFIIMPLMCTTLLLELCIYVKHVWPLIPDSSYLTTKVTKVLIISVGTSKILILSDQIVTESKKIMTTCYNIQDCISIYSKPYLELQEFTNKIPDFKVALTACGFYNIDRSIMFSIIGSVATYFIVAEQFWDYRVNKEFNITELFQNRSKNETDLETFSISHY